jgi:hypothetical protein
LADGEVASMSIVWRDVRIKRGRVARAVFPPEEVAQVKAIACELPKPGRPAVAIQSL